MTSQRIGSLRIDEKNIVAWSPVIAHERTVAMTDLLADNHFILSRFPAAGPYDIFLSIPEGRLRLEVSSMAGDLLETVILPLRPFLTSIREYMMVCESYYAATARGPEQVETLDMGRRSLHNDSASILQQLLAEQVELDHATARRLFTLICVLHLKG